MKEALVETSLFSVYTDGEESGLLLVQEEGMSHKPSLLLTLSAADILKYWSLLTPQQRAAFVDSHAPEAALLGPGEDLVVRTRRPVTHDTIFDRFAAAFHAFGCMERAVRAALDDEREKEASYRLFGKKYDSLGHLLERVAKDPPEKDIDGYVILLCARQACQEIAGDYPEYWARHRDDAKSLEAQLEHSRVIRHRLSEGNQADIEPFMEWFDRWFLRRAEPPAAVET